MREAATQDRRQNERAKLWIFREMETVATCSKTNGNGSYQELAPSFFEEMTCCRRQKHCWRRQDNPNGPSKFRKNIPCTFRFYVCSRLRDRDRCSATDSSGSCHASALSYFEEMTRCRYQKLHCRWPGNPKGWSKFCNLGLFTFTRCSGGGSTADGGFQISLKRHVTDVKNITGMTRIDRNSAITKIYAYESKQNVSKNFFLLLRTTPRLHTVSFVLSLATAFVFTFEK